MNKILLITLFFTLSLSAQNFKFGKVGKLELEESSYKLDENANAIVLFKKENVKFVYDRTNGFQQERTIHERIKIYNKEAYNYATKTVKLYNKSKAKSEEISTLKGYTFTLKDGKIVKTKLKKENIFEKIKNKYWKLTTFTMPNVSEGSVVEFLYTIKTPFLAIDDVIIQYDIPIKKLEIDVATPEFYKFNKLPNLKSKIQPVIKETKKAIKEVTYYRDRAINNNKANEFRSLKQQSDEYRYNDDVVQIYMENIPALQSEPYMGNLNKFRSKVVFEYAYHKSANGEMTSYATNWEKIGESINQNSNFGGQLNKTNFYKDDLAHLLNNTSDNKDKISKIFNYVKSKVKWNNFYAYTVDEGIKSAYKNGAGNVADINLLLISMLRSIGLDANPVLISTRDNGIPLYPTKSGFNYVVCVVKNENELMYLDATRAYTTPNILPINTLNWLGRVIRKDNSSDWLTLIPNKKSRTINSVVLQLNQDLSVSGKLKAMYSDYSAYNYRNNFGHLSNETAVKKIENDKLNFEVENLTSQNLNELNKPVLIDYEFNVDNAILEVSDKYLISPLAIIEKNENLFLLNERSYPIDFIYPYSVKTILNLEIPEGYELEALPKNAKINFGANEASFSYITKLVGNKIQILATLELNTTVISPDVYSDFKIFYQLMVDKKDEKIILKKS